MTARALALLFAVALSLGCKKDPADTTPPPSTPPPAASSSAPTNEAFCEKIVVLASASDDELRDMEPDDQAAFLAGMRAQCLNDAEHDRAKAPEAWATCARCIVAAKTPHEADGCDVECDALDQAIGGDAK